jgi:hypothetical protein
MLELMARGGRKIREVLNLSPKDMDEQKLAIRDVKSGKEEEVVFIPMRLARGVACPQIRSGASFNASRKQENVPEV